MSKIDLDENALTIAHVAVEDVLVAYRNSRISVINRGNGLVIREADGRDSHIMRLGTRDGLRIGITAYLAEVETQTVEQIAAWLESLAPREASTSLVWRSVANELRSGRWRAAEKAREA